MGAERFADLHRQGFMKGAVRRAPATERPVVACNACLNWHREGKHTATAEERRRNVAEEKARAARAGGVR